MTFFIPIVVKNYEWLNVVNGDYDVFNILEGGSVKNIWKPILMKYMHESDSYLKSDFPWLMGRYLVYRENSMCILKDILEKNGEILELKTTNNEVLFIHNTQVLNDALDESRSVIDRFRSGKILNIRKFVFDKNVVQGVDIFRVPYRSAPTFVSEKYVEIVKANNLVGIDFMALG